MAPKKNAKILLTIQKNIYLFFLWNEICTNLEKVTVLDMYFININIHLTLFELTSLRIDITMLVREKEMKHFSTKNICLMSNVRLLSRKMHQHI